VLQTLDLRNREATDDALAHTEYLYRLLHDEVERRESKQLSLRLRRASFDGMKSLEDFDFHFNPMIPKAKVIDLATCQFVERHENVGASVDDAVQKLQFDLYYVKNNSLFLDLVILLQPRRLFCLVRARARC